MPKIKLVLKDTFHETADKTDADPSEEKVFEGDLLDLDWKSLAQSNLYQYESPQNAFF